MEKDSCCICNRSDVKVKPLGPGRKPICLACAKSDPERFAIAEMYAKEAQDMRAQQRLSEPFQKIVLIPLDGLFSKPMGVDNPSADAFDPEQPTPGCDCYVCSMRRSRQKEHVSRAN